MARAVRLFAFFSAIAVLGIVAGVVMTVVRMPRTLSLQAQVGQSSGPVFGKGGRISVQANTQTFVFCTDGASVPITMEKGTLQAYQFEGYEWAESIVGNNSFPGKRLTIVDGQRPDQSAAGFSQFEPHKLYYLLSTAPFVIDCSRGAMESGGGGSGRCPQPSCANPPKDCTWSMGTDANGCPTCGTLRCIPGGSNNTRCPQPSCANPPKDCFWSMGTDANGCPTCGMLACANGESRNGDSGRGASSSNTNTGKCPTPSCANPPKDCFWSMGTDANGCPTCGMLACANGESRNGDSGRGASSSNTNTTRCPTPSCANPPKDCFWSMGTDANGCPTCGMLACASGTSTNGTSSSGESGRGASSSNTNTGKCPTPSCAAPPQGCTWSGGKDERGCSICGTLQCGTPASKSSALSSRISSAATNDDGSQNAASCEWKWGGSGDFSRDGSQLVFEALSQNPVMGGEIEYQLYLYDTAAGVTRRLTDESGVTGGPMTGADPVISGDGNVVAFVGRRSQAGLIDQRILRVDLNTNAVEDVTTGFMANGPTDISDDGRYILVNNVSCLYLYDSQKDSTVILAGIPQLNASCISSAKNPVSATPLNDRVFAREARITGNGRTVYFSVTDCNPANPSCTWSNSSSQTHSLYRYDVVSGAEPVRVGAFEGYALDITRDGSKMTFLKQTDLTGRRTLYAQDTAMQSLAQPVNAQGSVNQGGLFFFNLSSDGTAMSFYGGDPQTVRVFGQGSTIDMGSSAMMPLGAPLSPDGRFIFMADTGSTSFEYRGSTHKKNKLFVRGVTTSSKTVIPMPGAQCTGA